MKIAIVTDDGRTVSMHFGRAPYYAVLTVEGGQIVARELRDKFSPHLTGGAEEAHPAYQPHGTDAASHAKHASMATAVADCEVMIAGGMGRGAYQSFAVLGIRPVVTDLSDVDAVALGWAAGTLVDHAERLH